MALFLTLALGYWIGKLRLGSLPLGAVVGVLIAGVIIGQIGVKVSGDLKTAFFLLFLFAIGYRTGPQFFSGLRSSGLPQVALTVVRGLRPRQGTRLRRGHRSRAACGSA